jgi:WD40 repeat protein
MGPWIILLAAMFFGLVTYWPLSVGRGLRMNTVHPEEGGVWDAALSPDGNQVAMMRREGFDGSSPPLHEVIEIKDVRSDKDVASFWLPPRNWKMGHQSPIQYCDQGKYLLAFAGPDALFAINTSTFSIHSGIALGAYLLPQYSDHQVGSLTYVPLSSDLIVNCSADTAYVVLASWGDMQASSVKLFDLEKGAEVADLSKAYAGRYQGDGVAISPDGTRVAVVTWSNQLHGREVEIIDVHGSTRASELFMGQAKRLYPGSKDSVAFAGNNAVLIGEDRCPDGDEFCDFRPHKRVIRDWNLNDLSEPQKFENLGADTYQYFSGSADGKVDFSYSGRENFCQSCNSGMGETKIGNPRFLIWDRTSRRTIAESPALDVKRHSCFLAIGPGSCTAYEMLPEIQMSDNGKAVLVFMPFTSDDPPDRTPRPLFVFRRPLWDLMMVVRVS